jgi:hypothetical protein
MRVARWWRDVRTQLRALDPKTAFSDAVGRGLFLMPFLAARFFRKHTIPVSHEAPRWDHSALEAALLREYGRPVRLTLTENRSVLLSFRKQGGVVYLRLHRMFLYATPAVVRAVARGLKRTNRNADGEVRRFMNENLHRVRRQPQRMPVLEPRGSVYDLQEIYDRLNVQFFGDKLQVPVSWGRGSGRARRGGLTFGSYDPVLRLIRIHPVLDRREVPLLFLESVVYHEMLHHHLGGVPDRAGRTVYHSRVFREAEARYPQHLEALAWEKDNLPHLLRVSQKLERERRRQTEQARA